MATKQLLRVEKEKASGKFKYRLVLDYWHPQEEKWKKVSEGSNSTTRSTQEAVYNRLKIKIERSLAKGRTKKKSSLTVNEALELWHVSRKDAVAKGTYNNDFQYTQKFQAEYGSWQVSKVEKDPIQNFLMSLPVSHTVRKCTKSSLNLLFTYCEDEGIIEMSPMYRVRLPKHKETLAEQRKREDKGFTLDEVRTLIRAMTERERNEDDKRKRLMIEFHYYAGDRISETSGVQFSDIDVHKKVLKLDSQFDKYSSVSQPQLTTLKNRQSQRVITLNRRMIEIIEWFRGHNRTQSDFVFTRENGYVIRLEAINNYLKQFCDVLPYKLKSSFVSHALRHSLTTYQLENDVPLEAIIERGGWSDGQMITKVYGRHLTAKMQEKANNLLQKLSV